MNVVKLHTKLLDEQQKPEQPRKQFDRQRFAWNDRIMLDPAISDLQFRVAVVLSNRYLSFAKGYAWPKQEDLAADLGLGIRTIQYALNALVDAGYLGREVAHGRGRNNRYWLILDTENLQDGDIKPAPSCTFSDDEDSKTCTVTPENLHGDDIKPARPFVHIPLTIPTNNPTTKKDKGLTSHQLVKSAVNQQQLAEPITSDFETWWGQYPKRVSKTTALKAYRNVIAKKLATAEELLAGAMRYSAERGGQDLKFTKHPATWLNAGSWLTNLNSHQGLPGWRR